MTGELLAQVFTRRAVKELAGSRVYQRGRSYFRYGHIGVSTGGDLRWEAMVDGTVPYRVKLWVDGGRPGWSCTCPAAEDGSFCKHCTAVALSLSPVDPPEEEPKSAPIASGSKTPDQGLASIVSRLPQNRLVEIVVSHAESDPRLRATLVAESRTAGVEPPDVGEWREQIEEVFQSLGDFIPYDEVSEWYCVVDAVIDGLEQLCDAGHADAAAALAEHALRLAEAAGAYVDDSDGWMTAISERLIDVHVRACVEGRPDPVELAGRLLQLELELDGGPFQAAAAYADALGEEGLAAYHDLIEPRWRKANLKAGARFSGEDYEIHQAMVGWARATGDPDALIRVKTRSGLYSGAYLEISQALHRAGRREEAIEWARRGLSEANYPHLPLGDLREFLSDVLREGGDPAAAVDLYWDAFVSAPSLSNYRRLLKEAAKAPETDIGSHWTRRCTRELRNRLAGPVATEAPKRGAPPSAATVLAEMLFFEGRSDEAWKVATDFGCSRDMWLTLARAREEEHPLDAIAVYEPEVMRRIDQKKNRAYRAAVNLMDRIRHAARTAGEPHRFTEFLVKVRTQHKAKRNLKKLLDDKGW